MEKVNLEFFRGLELIVHKEAVTANWRKSRTARVVDVEQNERGVFLFIKIDKIDSISMIHLSGFYKSWKEGEIEVMYSKSPLKIRTMGLLN